MKSSRIIYGNKLAPAALQENTFAYDGENPYTVSIKKFGSDDITIPHYAATFEVLVCGDIEGEIIIGKNTNKDIKNKIFTVPPYCVHSMSIRKSSGILYVLKCSPESLDLLINVKKFITNGEFSIFRSPLMYSGSDYEEIRWYIEEIIKKDRDLPGRIAALLNVFSVLCRSKSSLPPANAVSEDTYLRRLIDWTEENASLPLNVEKAAGLIGYSKYYFCRWFKMRTGMTYFEYLTGVRMNKAAGYLRDGFSVYEAGNKCGYDSTPYFIRIFKERYGMTPKQYKKELEINKL